jgi:hypothetical protein
MAGVSETGCQREVAEWALTQPRGLEGQVRGVSHHGQETDLHLKAGYIDADFPSFINFSLAFRRRTIHSATSPLSGGT